MERIILPYQAQRPSTPARSPEVATAQGAYVPFGAPNPGGPGASTVGKGPGDYLRALRRRFWLLTLVAGTLTALGAVAVLRLPAVYRAEAQIEIVPPQFDSILASILAKDSVRLDSVSAEQYESNKLAQLRNKQIVDGVLRDPRIGAPVKSEDDPALELIRDLQTSQFPRSTWYSVVLEGDDPYRIETILNLWLEAYEDQSDKEIRDKILDSRKAAEANLTKLDGKLRELNDKITDAMGNSPELLPGGGNLMLDKYASIGQLRMQKQNAMGQIEQQLWLSRMFPKEASPYRTSDEERQIAALMEDHRALSLQNNQLGRTIRNPRDPARLRLLERRRDLEAEINRLQAQFDRDKGGNQADNVAETFIEQYQNSVSGELSALEGEEQKTLAAIQNMAPDHYKFLSLIEERQQTAQARANLQEQIDQFDVLSMTQNKPVRITQPATASSKPVRPNRAIFLALVVLGSIGAGLGLVLVLEHADRSVRAPEQLAHGIALPLLGVIPMIRRTARLQRGGHLWTAGSPQCAAADAYRNLRASLVGMGNPGEDPAVTLLIASAKAGEGKSTTALNLAATCARSGERTLLMDVDLRRPSLRSVFDDGEHDVGLVDVLRGELPWQRTLVRTDVPNLDFLPTGDPSGVPVEILGALELKQLIAAVSGHYDRVILDGPAILGLADCRMLGRVVDAALLVVRAGANDLRPVLRAQSMLEQSRAPLVGVVFNGLNEDMGNWSCVESYLDGLELPDAAEAARLGKRREPKAALAASAD